jgi:hypothetical protein
MFKRTDWLHVHGRRGGLSDSEEDSSSADDDSSAGARCD